MEFWGKGGIALLELIIIKWQILQGGGLHHCTKLFVCYLFYLYPLYAERDSSRDSERVLIYLFKSMMLM